MSDIYGNISNLVLMEVIPIVLEEELGAFNGLIIIPIGLPLNRGIF